MTFPTMVIHSDGRSGGAEARRLEMLRSQDGLDLAAPPPRLDSAHDGKDDDADGAGADVAPDSIATHPLGVKPLGNKYLWTGPVARKSAGSLGWVPDEIIMMILERFGGRELAGLGATCRFLYAFCRSDELWKALFLSAPPVKPVWRGSWRATVLGLESKSIPVDCSNVFSDVLHRPFACSQINLAQYASGIPRGNLITRFDRLSPSEFAESWAEKPFVMTDAVRTWPACREWTVESLLARYASVEFRAEAVDWPLETYCAYMADNSDESPLYLFDRKFAEKMGITVGSEEPGDAAAAADMAYWRPDTFGPDLFEVLGAERPAHRWLIMGPRGSGSTFHKDPNATSAWNAVVQGSKYWIMFPPDAPVPGVYVSDDSSEVTSPLSIAEWLLTFHAEARQTEGCVEGVCGAGEILHVPSGWWHLVVNLEAGVALTQNFVPRTSSLHHLVEALSFLRDRPEQVTGFSADVADPYGLFVERMGERYPGLVEEAIEKLERRKKRKWDEVTGGDEEKVERGRFSFGFGGDDLEEEENDV